MIQAGVDVNARCDDGASAIFSASLGGNVEMVQVLLDMGADPNLIAQEPAASMYCKKALDLVMQAQALMDWDKYTPVFHLLVSKGATQFDGTVPTDEEEKARHQRVIERRAGRDPLAIERPWWKFW